MGKMKALLIDREEENRYQEEQEEYDVLMEEMYYINTIQAFVTLITEYGFSKVMSDLSHAMEDK
jgi:hypothetical protein